MYIEREIEEFYNLHFLIKYLLGHSGFIAGGCFKNIFTGNKIKDLDMFFRDEKDYVQAKNMFTSDAHYDFYYENDKVYAVKEKETGVVIELIRYVFGKPEEILNNFDFTITKFCLYTEETEDGFRNKIIHHEKFFEHLMLKRTVIDDKCLYPESTFERIIKYTKYGFYPCRETKIKLIEALKTSTGRDISNSLYDGID